MGKIKNYIILSLAFCSILACHSANKVQKIIVFTGCENVETYQDILISIEENTKFFQLNGIEIQIDTIDHNCGYKLVKNDSAKIIESSLTDIDLKLVSTEFFNLQ